jgi:hypothetical protein
VSEQEVGRLVYDLSKTHLFVHMVYNHQPEYYAKVGTALMDYAFDISIERDRKGNVVLFPIPGSALFFEKNLGLSLRIKQVICIYQKKLFEQSFILKNIN